MPPPATDSIAGLDPQAGSTWHGSVLPPLLKAVTRSRRARPGRRWSCARTRAGEHPGLSRHADPADPGADRDAVLSTSTVLMNHTPEALLPHFSSARRTALIGPSAACLPDALFACGRHLHRRHLITQPAGVIEALATGGPCGRPCAQDAAHPCRLGPRLRPAMSLTQRGSELTPSPAVDQPLALGRLAVLRSRT